MAILNKISNSFKPKNYEYVINEPIDQMQLKLDTFFNRGFWKSLFDSEFNISGSFTNKSKTEFKICLTVGPYTTGGANFYYGTLENINADSTKVILKNHPNKGGVIALIVFFLWIIAFITSWINNKRSNNLTFETLFGLIFIVCILFFISKISGAFNNSLKSDFEKILKKQM
jgi:hypothetical protein